MMRPRSRIRKPSRKVSFEVLEHRQMLAAEILFESFKTMEFSADGLIQGSTGFEIIDPPWVFAEQHQVQTYFSGAVVYSSPTQGIGSSMGIGGGGGQHYCSPDFFFLGRTILNTTLKT